MIVCNPARLTAAQQLLARFRAAGRPAKAGGSAGHLCRYAISLWLRGTFDVRTRRATCL